MKKIIFPIFVCVVLVTLIIMLLKSNTIIQNKPNDKPIEFKEAADYYRNDIYKFKPTDFESKSEDLFLSNIVENFSIIKLDNENKNALLNGRAFPYITESYIGMISDDLPFKLFNKTTGAFLGDIGKIGEGPEEYYFISDVVIDEKNDRIYIYCVMRSYILEYNLNGEYLGKINIPGIHGMRKFKFTISDNIITAFIMTYDKDKDAVISFTPKGDSISSAPARVFMPEDTNMEIFIQTNTPLTGYSHTASSVYYNYDPSKKELIPAFAFDKTMFSYVYVQELNNFYLFEVNELNKEKKYYSTDHIILYDKTTKKGKTVNLINDYMGGISFSKGFYSNGIYHERMTASDFRDNIKKALKKNKLTDEKRKYLSDLVKSMTDDDNDIIFYGILKK